METTVNREERVATTTKIVEWHLLAVKKLFRVSGAAGTESLSPAQRAFDAELQIGQSRRLLGTRERHPELDDLFFQLDRECERAEERLVKYKEHWRLE